MQQPAYKSEKMQMHELSVMGPSLTLGLHPVLTFVHKNSFISPERYNKPLLQNSAGELAKILCRDLCQGGKYSVNRDVPKSLFRDLQIPSNHWS